MGLSGWDLFTRRTFSPINVIPPSGSFRDVSPEGRGEDAATGGRAGPLTVRQKFLLGRRVNLNKAGYEEISGLPGISDTVAKAIVKERERLGSFRRPDDLLAVRGIKEKRLKKILPFIIVFPNN
jgi:competence ComEA-like helix-hairpin-helix protein